jgi:protein-S-isoprenylcysteine O-methyltransferase Ste14
MSPRQLLLLFVLTAVAVAASVHSLRTKQAYGAFRFLAFETLAVLIVWNANHWFSDTTSIPQIVSWALFATSAALAVHGVHLLRVVGRAQARIMEDTQTVVEAGAYRFIRHPLYSCLVLFGWGVFFKGMDSPSAALALAATAFLVATARYEEGFNIQHFGAAYSDYMKRTKMFIPFLL